MSSLDLHSLHFNKIAKIKKHIKDEYNGLPFEAYQYFFRHALDDLRKDFLTGVSYHRNFQGEQIPVENDLDTIKSMAMSCGLNESKIQAHLMRHLGLLPTQWLIDIPAWDGVDRVQVLCFGTQVKNLSKQCFYEHLLAWGAGIFARGYDNYKQNHVMILRGNQGIGKDFFLKTICKGLGPYFGTWTNSRDEREIIMLMERSLVLNIPEFDNTHQNEIAMLKGLITKYQATFRSPYARKAMSVKLRTSFISSANCEYLLRDSTGNRRYLIFWLEKFDLIDKFDEFDSLQILAQFKYAHEQRYVVSPEQKAASDAYIFSQTPPPIEEQIFEFWNDEVRDYLRLSNSFGERDGGWLPAKHLSHIFEKVRKEFKFGRNHLTLLLQNRECRTKKNGNILYRAAPKFLGVVENESQ